jgi:hypothetical protein
MPKLATEHSAAGARAFAEFFIKTIDWGYATTSSAYMRHYALADCQGCSAFAEFFDRARRAHHQFIGARMTITSARSAPKPLASGSDATAIVVFNILSFEEVTSSGKYVQADIAHSAEKFQVSMRWSSNGWLVRHLSASAS